MKTIKIEFEMPTSILLALNEQKEEFVSEVRLYSALKLFEKHKLSLGKAAEVAGLNKWNFLDKLAENNISVVDYPVEDLEEEIQRMKSL